MGYINLAVVRSRDGTVGWRVETPRAPSGSPIGWVDADLTRPDQSLPRSFTGTGLLARAGVHSRRSSHPVGEPSRMAYCYHR